ncbi:MAG TPA: efflux RND transporter periplasmic adaptor subunit [Candidatus Acidoferrales bacterium]|nr:efflux RND transporter periplasmic adaptor subunit [Candidatus Acidoferrales bacterium]
MRLAPAVPVVHPEKEKLVQRIKMVWVDSRWWIPALAGFCLALLPGCSPSKSASAAGSAEATAQSSQNSGATEYVAADSKGIQTVTVQKTSVPDYLDLPAHIEADPTRVVHVYPPIGGRIVEMKVRPWDHVAKGEPLALIESADLSRAVADYHKAIADNAVKQAELNRSKDLFEHNAIAEKDYQQAQADALSSQADLTAAREQIRVFGVDPDHASSELSVVAPRSGVILDVGASPGEFSKSLDAPEPLCTVADIGTVWAIGDIYESDLAAAKPGQDATVTLSAYPGQHWSGRVSVVSDAVDPATRTLHVRVTLANPGERIKPQMFGTIRLTRSVAQAILVPASAVVREGNNAYVFVARGSGRYARRSVDLGRVVGNSVEIAGGLAPGEILVSQDPLLLRAAGQD